MLTQPAQVLAVRSGQVQVSVSRRSSCSGCQQKSGCGVSSVARYFEQKRSATQVESVWLESAFSLHPGDWVELELPEEALLRASVRVYLLPLVLSLLAGVALSQLFPSTLSDLGALVGLVLGGALGFYGLSAQRQVSAVTARTPMLRVASVMDAPTKPTKNPH